MLKEKAKAEYPGLYWSALNWEQPYPNGESPRQFYERVKTAWIIFKKSAEDLKLCCENGKIYTNKHQTYGLGNAEIMCV